MGGAGHARERLRPAVRVRAVVGRDGRPGLARFAWVTATWGEGHPYNPPLPNPLPAALLDLLLDHPGAAIHSARCPGCHIFVPCTPHSGSASDGSYKPPRPLADACPVCVAPR